MQKNVSKKFFLISFLPALAYWYLESNYSLRVALAGGVILATLEVSLEKFFTKHVHSISKLNFVLIVFLGAISFIGDEGIWFKLQPFFTGVLMGTILVWKTHNGGSFMYETMESMNSHPPPREVVIRLENHSGYFVFIYGLFMAYVALNMSTERWLFYKTAGFYIVFFGFFILETLLMRRSMKKSLKR